MSLLAVSDVVAGYGEHDQFSKARELTSQGAKLSPSLAQTAPESRRY